MATTKIRILQTTHIAVLRSLHPINFRIAHQSHNFLYTSPSPSLVSSEFADRLKPDRHPTVQFSSGEEKSDAT
eukprot:scaffold4463_cov162-Pinguiococcus_pyrenoidosus.AAC.1